MLSFAVFASGRGSNFLSIYDSIQAGGAGVAFGRNVFQAKNPIKLVNALSKIIHQDYTLQEIQKEFHFI